ncbi:fungal-specific transcription factor domain-containing protein [Lipomyces oligophaga]|uniref:fungal-specific transcription factor domain-containing protein n=1 Tax=Lipomyces oligophaga TaxID=45792 RepID=UPI0034CFC169
MSPASARALGPTAPQLHSDEDEDEDYDHELDHDYDQSEHEVEDPSFVENSELSTRGSKATNGTSPQTRSNAAAPIQKRRRVTRACDECRRKKIKCDGKQPCTHCTVYSYDCTYDQPSNRRRNPAPFYISQLESRLQQSNTVLQALLPGVDIFSNGFDVPRFLTQIKTTSSSALREVAAAGRLAANAQVPSLDPASAATASSATQLVSATPSAQTKSSESPASNSDSPSSNIPTGTDADASMESMVVSLGRLDVDETGHLDYVGHSSGRAFLQHLRARFLNNHPDAIPAHIPKLNQFYYSPQSASPETPLLSGDSPSEYHYYQQVTEFKIILPPQDVAERLISTVWSQAFIVMWFSHRPTFDRRLEELYSADPDDYTPQQVNFLPLVYCYLAVGVLFSSESRTGESYDLAEGYKYFVAARNMIDITEARDTDAIQAIILMVIFLQSTARLSTCYSYVGAALRAALRLGLHRKLAYNFNPVEAEVRKRIFWAIRKMDVHIGAMLGLPRSIDNNDIDQEDPLEIEDEYITENGILPHPIGVMTHQTIGNVHMKLMNILSNIVEDVYPIKSRTPVVTVGTSTANSVSYAKVVELENDLQQWLDSLPFELRPGIDPPEEWLQANRLLNMAFCYVKIILYRPFIHYIAQKSKDTTPDQRAYSCAANCISTSRMVIHLADDLVKRDMLRGAHLFSVYTIFFSVAVLVYYVHEDPHNPHVNQFFRDAELGRSVIYRIKANSTGAARSYDLLSGLFKLLEKQMKEMKNEKTGGPHDDPKRKRSESVTASGSLHRTSSVPSMRRPPKASAATALHYSLSVTAQQRRALQQLQQSATSRPRSKAQGHQTKSVPPPGSVQTLGRSSTLPATLANMIDRNNAADSDPDTTISTLLDLQMPGSEQLASPLSTRMNPRYIGTVDNGMPQQNNPLDDVLSYSDVLNSSGTNSTIGMPSSGRGQSTLGLDFLNEFNSMTSSNIDTGLYFPSIITNSNSNISSGVRPAEPVNTTEDATSWAGVRPSGFDRSRLLSPEAEDTMSPQIMAYSTGPMDMLEAQLFGKYVPKYESSAVNTTVPQASTGVDSDEMSQAEAETIKQEQQLYSADSMFDQFMGAGELSMPPESKEAMWSEPTVLSAEEVGNNDWEEFLVQNRDLKNGSV